MPALSTWLPILIRAGKMSRGESQRWTEWAVANPKAAALAARMMAGWCDHRVYLLRHRRVWFGRQRRIARLNSWADGLQELACTLDEVATSSTS